MHEHISRVIEDMLKVTEVRIWSALGRGRRKAAPLLLGGTQG